MVKINKAFAVILSAIMLLSCGTVLAGAQNVFTVSFDANGGSFGADAVTLKAVAEGDAVTSEGITVPAFTFKDFAGWALNKNAASGVTDSKTAIAEMGGKSLTLYATWKNAACGDSAEYTVSSGVLTISGSGTVRAGADWAKNAGSITSVEFAKGCTFDAIAPETFAGLTAVKSVDLTPVASIEEAAGAFTGCTALEKVTLPEGTAVIPDKFFKGCSALKEFAFDGIEKIGNEAFLGCSALPTILVFEKGSDIELDPKGKGLGFDINGKAISGYTIVTDGEKLTAFAKENGFYMSHLTYTVNNAFATVKLLFSSVTKYIPALWSGIRSLIISITGLVKNN